MKRSLGWIVLAGVVVTAALALVHAARPRPARASGCAVDTLQGTYGIHVQGWLSQSSSAGTLSAPFAQAGLATSDGAGNLFLKVSTSVNGQITKNISVSMQYQLDGDCTGSMAPASGSDAGPADIVVVDGGKQFFVVGTQSGATISGTAIRQ